MKYTPGPWTIDAEHSDMWIDAQLDSYAGLTICQLGDYNREVMQANANLIAAAPDLFESLRDILEGVLPTSTHHYPVVQRAVAALAKAGGQ